MISLMVSFKVPFNTVCLIIALTGNSKFGAQIIALKKIDS